MFICCCLFSILWIISLLFRKCAMIHQGWVAPERERNENQRKDLKGRVIFICHSSTESFDLATDQFTINWYKFKRHGHRKMYSTKQTTPPNQVLNQGLFPPWASKLPNSTTTYRSCFLMYLASGPSTVEAFIHVFLWIVV